MKLSCEHQKDRYQGNKKENSCQRCGHPMLLAGVIHGKEQKKERYYGNTKILYLIKYKNRMHCSRGYLQQIKEGVNCNRDQKHTKAGCSRSFFKFSDVKGQHIQNEHRGDQRNCVNIEIHIHLYFMGHFPATYLAVNVTNDNFLPFSISDNVVVLHTIINFKYI